MKRWIKRGIRFVVALVIVVIALGMVVIGAVHSSQFVRGVIVPLVNRYSPYQIKISSWRLRIWSSLAIEGLSVHEVTSDGAATNLVAEVKSLDVRYRFASLLASPPQLDRIIIERPTVGLAARVAEAPSGAEREERARRRKEGARRPGELPELPVPVAINELRVRNGRVTYVDEQGTHAEVNGLNLFVERFGPQRRGRVALDATCAYTDGKSVILTRMPVSLRVESRLGESLIPTMLTVECTLSNLAGRIEQLDVQPLAGVFAVYLQRRTPTLFELVQCDASLRWQDTLLAYVSLTGSVDVAAQEVVQELVVKLNSSPLWQAFLKGVEPLDVRATQAEITLATRAQGKEQKMQARLVADVRNVGMRDPQGRLVPGLDVKARAATEVDARRGMLAVPELHVTAAQERRTFLTARTLQPVTVFWRGTGRASAPDKASVEVVLDRFELGLLNGFLGTGNVHLAGGICDARVHCDVVDAGASLATHGGINLSDVKLQVDQARWNDLDLNLQWAAEAQQMRFINISRASAQLGCDDVPAGQFAAGGYFDLTTGTNRLAVAIAKLSSAVLQPVLDPQKENPRLAGLDITVQMLTEKSDPSRRAQQVGLDVSIENAGRRVRDEWDKLRLNVHAAVRPEVVRVHRATLDLQPARFPDNRLSFNGELMLQPTNVASTFSISSEQFDATVLLDTFMPVAAGKRTSAGTDQERSGSAGPSSTLPEQNEPAPLPFEGRDATVRVRIDELRAREMLFLPLYVDVLLTNSVLSVRTPEVRLNGGRIDLASECDFGVTGYAYRVALSITNLPLQPLVNSLAPAHKDSVDGLLATDVTLSGRGMRLPSMRRYLYGDVNAWLLNGRLVNTPILSAVGRALRLEALENYSFGDGVVRAHVTTGIIHVSSVALQGPLARVNVRGNVTLEQQLDLMMHLALSAKGITDLLDNRVPFAGQLGRYYDLPVPIPITGTLKSPRVGVPYQSVLDQFMPMLGLDPRALLDTVMEKLPTETLRREVDSGVKMIRGLLDNVPLPGGKARQP